MIYLRIEPMKTPGWTVWVTTAIGGAIAGLSALTGPRPRSGFEPPFGALLRSAIVVPRIRDPFFEGGARVLGLLFCGSQIPRIGEAGEEFGKRVTSFERQAAGLVRPADEILNQEKLTKQGGGQKEAPAVDLPAALQ